MFSHGVSSLGRATTAVCSAWAYPADFAVLARYHPALRALPPRSQMPDSLLTMQQLTDFLAAFGDRFAPKWEGLGAGGRSVGRQLAAR